MDADERRRKELDMDREIAPRESAAPAAPGHFEAEADVVVVGAATAGCRRRCSAAGWATT
jgi:hypothetical protein